MCLVHVCNTFIFTFKDCLFETYADVVVPGTQRVSAHLKPAVGSKEVQVPKDKDRVEGKFSLSLTGLSRYLSFSKTKRNAVQIFHVELRKLSIVTILS